MNAITGFAMQAERPATAAMLSIESSGMGGVGSKLAVRGVVPAQLFRES